MDWLYSLSGFLVGLVVGVTGVGGARCMTPLLVLVFVSRPSPRSERICFCRID